MAELNNNRNFKGVWIPKEVWTNRELTWMEKLLLVEIDSLDNANGCYASNEYFAEFFDLSQDRISKIVTSLKRKGFVTVKLNKYEGNKTKRHIRVDKKKFYGLDEELSTSSDRLGENAIDSKKVLGENAVLGLGENADYNNTSFINNTNNIKDYVISKETTAEPSDVDLVERKLKESKNIKRFTKLSTNRKSAINARIREYKLQGVLDALEKIEKSDFLSKAKFEKNNWLTIDWIFKPGNFVKIVDGNYDNNDNSYNNYNTSNQQQATQYEAVSINNLFEDA